MSGTIGPGDRSSLFVRRPTEEGRPVGSSDIPSAGPVTVRVRVATLAAVTVKAGLVTVTVTVLKAGVGRTKVWMVSEMEMEYVVRD